MNIGKLTGFLSTLLLAGCFLSPQYASATTCPYEKPIALLSTGQSVNGVKMRRNCEDKISGQFCTPRYGVRFFSLPRGKYVINRNVGMGAITVAAHVIRKATNCKIEILHEAYGGAGIDCWNDGCIKRGQFIGPLKYNILNAPPHSNYAMVIQVITHGEKDMNSQKRATGYFEGRKENHRYVERKYGKIDFIVMTRPLKIKGSWRNRLLHEHLKFAIWAGAAYVVNEKWQVAEDGVHAATLETKVWMGLDVAEVILDYMSQAQ